MNSGQVTVGDCLEVLQSFPASSVDLVYVDPPFGTGRDWGEFTDRWQPTAAAARLPQRIGKVVDAAHAAGGDSTKSYLLMMAPRLLELKRVLKTSGSIYLHCDPTESHALKLVMDTIFGREHFLNEVIWWYEKWTNTIRCFQRNHDVLLVYRGGPHAVFNKQLAPPTKRQKQLVDTGYNLGSSGGQPIVRIYDRKKTASRIPGWKAEGRSIYFVNPPPAGKPIPDVWQLSALNGRAKERVGYPTQKPLDLLRRIIRASSNPGDLVLDPMCGSGTALVAAEELGRRWAGIDLNPIVPRIVKSRLLGNIVN